MKSPRKMLALATAALLALPSFAMPQQQGTQQGLAPPKPQGPTITSRTSEVTVPVTVKDANGELVPTLRASDFRIFDDKVEQKITHISVESVPMSAVILLDDSLKSKPEQELQASLRAISGGFGPNDEAAIFRFDQFPQQVSDFISDPDQLLAALKRVQVDGGRQAPANYSSTTPPLPTVNASQAPAQSYPSAPLWGGNGTKSIYDAVFAAAELLKTRPHDRRKIIFLISDAVGSKGDRYTRDETVNMLLSADAAVYSIGIGVPLQNRILKNPLVHLANDSGGDTFYASNQADLERLYSRVADEARNRYLLYYSPDHNDRVVTYHSIEVRVRMSGLDVLARNGYYSAPQR